MGRYQTMTAKPYNERMLDIDMGIKSPERYSAFEFYIKKPASTIIGAVKSVFDEISGGFKVYILRYWHCDGCNKLHSPLVKKKKVTTTPCFVIFQEGKMLCSLYWNKL